MPVMKNPQSAIRNPQLLFVHGWATDSRIWKYQTDEFSNDYEVAAIDLPGHSGNDEWGEPTLKPAIEKVLSTINPTSHILHPTSRLIGIGWSLGGQALLEAAANRPGYFKALVLIGVSPCFVAKRDFPFGQSAGVAKRMLKDLKKDFTKTAQRFYPLNFTEKELLQPEARWFIELYKKSNLKSFRDSAVTALEALLAIDLRDIISHIKIPVLIIHGEKDTVCPVDTGRYLAENMSDARLEIFKDTGHAPFLTRRKEFNLVVKEFLEKI